MDTGSGKTHVYAMLRSEPKVVVDLTEDLEPSCVL